MKFTSESAYRAVRTFVQAFFGVLVGNMTLISALDFTMEPKTVITTICIQIFAPAISAGIAAVMNMSSAKETEAELVGTDEEDAEEEEKEEEADEEEEEEDIDDEEEIYG